MKEKRGLLNLFREISIETGVDFALLRMTSATVTVDEKPVRPTFSPTRNINPRVWQRAPPHSTKYRRLFASLRQVSLNNTDI